MGVYIPPEEVARAKEVGLLQYIEQKDPGRLKRKGRDYTLDGHNSFILSRNGLWHYASKGIGGGGAIDYLMSIEGMTFQEAVYEILNTTPADYQRPVREKADPVPKQLTPPEAENDTGIVERYLVSRGITPEVIRYFVKKGDLYQSAQYHSACFVGRDTTGTPRLVNVRGTVGTFKQNVEGSDRRFSFQNYYPGRQTAHFFEAPIDMLSYAVLLSENGYDFRTFNLVSLSGITGKGKEEEVILPIPVQQYISDHPDVHTFYTHFDNDEAGQIAGRRLVAAMPKNKTVILQSQPPGYKDVNEYLVKRPEAMKAAGVQKRSASAVKAAPEQSKQGMKL